jgi:hypothetical protein
VTELTRLMAAIARHCPYQLNGHPSRRELCPVHAMLSDQAALDHLLYGYRLRHQLIEEEFRT